MIDKAKANIEVASFELEHTKAVLTETELTFNRIKELLADKVTSLSKYDIAEARCKRAVGQTNHFLLRLFEKQPLYFIKL